MIVVKPNSPHDTGEHCFFFDFACDHCGEVIGALDNGLAVWPGFEEPVRNSSTGNFKSQKARQVHHVHDRCLDAFNTEHGGDLEYTKIGDALAEMLRIAIVLLDERNYDARYRANSKRWGGGLTTVAQRKSSPERGGATPPGPDVVEVQPGE